MFEQNSYQELRTTDSPGAAKSAQVPLSFGAAPSGLCAYQAYQDASLIGSSPAQIVTALYKGAIDACVHARQCFQTGDVMGRSRAVTRAVNILTELMAALDHKAAPELSLNLKRLYSYMQQRLLAAHMEKRSEPLDEVERLLRDMVEAWYKVAESHGHNPHPTSDFDSVSKEVSAPVASGSTYGTYYEESAESVLGHAFSF